MADKQKESVEVKVVLAKKDFVINHTDTEKKIDYHRVIKKGEDVSDVPALYQANLKTEGVV